MKKKILLWALAVSLMLSLAACGKSEAAKAVDEMGILGALTGGVTAAAGGISAAIFFGWLVALIFKPKPKSR